MLIITRHIGESIWVGENIQIHVLNVKGRIARLGLTLPKDIGVYRSLEHWAAAMEQKRKEMPR